MAVLPHDRESFLSTQLKSATVEDNEECGICQDIFRDPVELPCGHIFCRDCICLWLAGKKSCPLDRVVLFEAEDVSDVDEQGPPSVEELTEMATERIRFLDANIASVQETFRVMRRLHEKSYYNLFTATIKEAKSQAEFEEACEGLKVYRQVHQLFRTNEQTQWSAFASKYLASAAEFYGREADSIDPSQFPDVLIVAQAKTMQFRAAESDFIWLVKTALEWGEMGVYDTLRELDMEDMLQNLRLDEDGEHEGDEHGDDDHEDDLEDHDELA